MDAFEKTLIMLGFVGFCILGTVIGEWTLELRNKSKNQD